MATPATILTYTTGGTNFVHPTFDSSTSSLIVKVNGVTKTLTTDYTVSGGSVVFNTSVAAGDVVDIIRETSVSSRLVDWTNISIINEENQDKDSKQAIHKLQELVAETEAGRLIKRNAALDDQWDANAKKIVNLGTPTAGTDAATKGYADDILSNLSLGSIPVTKISDFSPATLENAIDVMNANQSTNYTIAISSEHVLSTTKTPLDHITWLFLGNGKISPNSGVEFNPAGSIIAGPSQHIFGGQGDVKGDLKVPFIWVGWYGAKPDDGTTDNTAAFNKAIDTAFQTGIPVRATAGNFGFATPILLKDGVDFGGAGMVNRTGAASIKGTDLFPTDAFVGTSLIGQTGTGTLKGMRIHDMTLRGNKPGGGNISKLVHWTDFKYCGIERVFGEFCENQAIHWEDNTSGVSYIRDCLFQNTLQTTSTLSVFEGAIQIEGQDNIIADNEVVASQTALSSDEKRAALLLTDTAANNFIYGGQLAFADNGIRTETNASRNQFVNVRCDLNWGSGALINTGGNSFVGCQFLNNGQATDATYNGIELLQTNNVVSGCRAISNTSNRHFVGFYNKAASKGNRVKGSVSTGHSLSDYREDFNTYGWRYDFVDQETATADDTTPTAFEAGSVILPTNTARQEITRFDDAFVGQTFAVVNAGGNDLFSYILHDGSDFNLKKPWYPQNNDSIFFLKRGSAVQELARSQRGELHSARYEFDASSGAAVGDHQIGWIDDNAVIVNAFYKVQSGLTSGTSTATLAMGVKTDDATGIVPATVITNAVWDTSNQGFHIATPVKSTPSSYTTQTTANREIIATVGVEALTAGKVFLVIEWIITQ